MCNCGSVILRVLNVTTSSDLCNLNMKCMFIFLLLVHPFSHSTCIYWAPTICHTVLSVSSNVNILERMKAWWKQDKWSGEAANWSREKLPKSQTSEFSSLYHLKLVGHWTNGSLQVCPIYLINDSKRHKKYINFTFSCKVLYNAKYSVHISITILLQNITP